MNGHGLPRNLVVIYLHIPQNRHCGWWYRYIKSHHWILGHLSDFLDKPMWEQLLGARPREATLSPRQWVTCQWNPTSSSIFQRSFQNLQIFTEHPGVYHSNLGFAWLGCNLSFHPILGCLGIQVALREGAASFRGLNFVFFVPTWPSPASSSLVLDGEEYVALTELNLW